MKNKNSFKEIKELDLDINNLRNAWAGVNFIIAIGILSVGLILV